MLLLLPRPLFNQYYISQRPNIPWMMSLARQIVKFGKLCRKNILNDCAQINHDERPYTKIYTSFEYYFFCC